MTGTQPRPLRYRGRLNRRGRRARWLKLKRDIAETRERFGGPMIYDPEFGSMPLVPGRQWGKAARSR
jgi:hypothetical protein